MSRTATQRSPARPVLLFDGQCGLCNRLVRVLLRLDRAGRLNFAPLQEPSAQAFLRTHGLSTTDFDTLIFVPDWGHAERSDFLVRTNGLLAALRATDSRVARVVGGLLGGLPMRMRDAGYRLVARWRYRIFGPWRPRPLTRPGWRGRFLDGVE